MADLFIKHYDLDGKIVPAAKAVLAVEAESDADVVNNRNITHPTLRCSIWSVADGKFDECLGDFARWEPAQRKAQELLDRMRRGVKPNFWSEFIGRR